MHSQCSNCYCRCAACSKCFLNSNKLKYHIRRTHLPVDGAFQCTNCDKECRTLRLLLNHQKSHIRVHCPHCKKIVSAANYDHHVRTAHANRIRVHGKKRPIADKSDVTSSKKVKEDNKTIATKSRSPNHRKNVSQMKDTCVRVSMFGINCRLICISN